MAFIYGLNLFMMYGLNVYKYKPSFLHTIHGLLFYNKFVFIIIIYLLMIIII